MEGWNTSTEKQKNQGNCYENYDKVKKVVSTNVKTSFDREWINQELLWHRQIFFLFG